MTKRYLELKALSEDGSFEGILSPYGVLDNYDDIVDAGAFSKTIQERGDTIPLLWQHRSDMPIGTLKLIDTPEALKVRGQLVLSMAGAQNAYTAMKEKIVRGLSIGFRTVKDSWDGNVRHLKEVKLYEGSIVTFPANEYATITAVKSGRTISADTAAALQDAHDQLMAAAEKIYALIGTEAGSSTSAKGAATAEPAEPGNHSDVLFDSLIQLIPR
jgi:hypothetical protein